MGFLKWTQKRKVKKFSRLFGSILESGDVQSALTLYNKNLSPLSYEVDKSVRAAYHFYNWLTFNQEEDFRAIQLLAINELAKSQIIRTLEFVRYLERQRKLAWALIQRNPDALKILKESNDPVESEPINNLGVCILEILTLNGNTRDKNEYRNVAANILQYLPAADKLKEPFNRIRDSLYVWAMYMNRSYADLIKGIDALESIPIESRLHNKIEAIYKWCEVKLNNDHIEEAIQILKHLEQYVESRQLFKIILAFGLALLNRNASSSAVKWFSSYIENLNFDNDQVLYNTFLLFLGVSYFKDNKLVQGREIFEQLQVNLDASPEDIRPLYADSITKKELLCLVWYLQILSLLAETGNWPGSAAQNPAMWRSLREKAQQYTKKLAVSSSPQAWQGHFLDGLIAYVESSSAINAEQLGKFTSAIENVSSKEGRIRLKSIEEALLTRVKATDEAIQLVKKGKHQKLREFQQNVLEPLGDAIPALVRAIVYMAIWESYPSYDPLPALKQIPRTPDNETSINKCIIHVQAIQIIRKLKDICVNLKASSMNLPLLAPLSFNQQVAQIGNLAAAVVHLHNKKWHEALNNSYLNNPASNEWFQRLSGYLIFYAAWQAGKVTKCRQIIGDGKRNSMLIHTKQLTNALTTRFILDALENGRENSSREFIKLNQKSDIWNNMLISFVIWLIEHKKNEIATGFLGLVKEKLINKNNTDAPDQKAGSGIYWLCLFLEGMILANTGKYNACVERFEQTISKTPPPGSIFKESLAVEQLQGWAKLFILQAKLALTAQSTDDMKVRWPSLRRTLEIQAKELKGNQVQEAYGHLITGLVSYLSTDMLIDESIIINLALAQEEFSLIKKIHFIEEIIGKLNWRKNVLEDFWIRLSNGKFRESQTIYQNELKPAFENRMPHSIQLAMIMVDWDLNNEKTTELLKRLSLLEHDAPELNSKLLTQVKNYVLEGDKLRHLKKLVEDQEFKSLIDFVSDTEWEGFGKGAMPVPVAIALLYAYYKTKKEEDALYLGEIISGEARLPDWVKDYGMLLMGYVRFEKKEYKKAIDYFGNISRSRVLGHDVDEYWAASHFSNGLQLLGVNQKEQAYDAFARAITKRGAALENIKLAQLFFDLALKNIESRNGTRAINTFQLLNKSLKGLETIEDAFIPVFISNIGELLCKSLLDGDYEKPDEKDFSELIELLKHAPDSVPIEVKNEFERICRIMTICHVLRNEIPLKSGLKEFLEKHLKAIEVKTKELNKEGPVVFVLRALIELKINGNFSRGLKWFKSAKRLGCQSVKLDDLFKSVLDNLKNESERNSAAIDLFDTYLKAGEIPLANKEKLMRHDDIGELYRLNRAYVPDEIVTEKKIKSGIEVMCDRLNNIIKWINKNKEIQKDNGLKTLCSDLKKGVDAIRESEEKILGIEGKILDKLAEKIRSEKLN